MRRDVEGRHWGVRREKYLRMRLAKYQAIVDGHISPSSLEVGERREI